MKPWSAAADVSLDPFWLGAGVEPDIDIGAHHSSPRRGALQWSPTSRPTWHRGGADRNGHGEGGTDRARPGRATRLRNKVSEGTFARDRLTVRGGTSEMGDPILLPKFELPGEKTHWAVRLAVI